MDKLSNIIGFTLPKGASDSVDNTGAKILKEFGLDKLKEIAKINFKNTIRINNIK